MPSARGGTSSSQDSQSNFPCHTGTWKKPCSGQLFSIITLPSSACMSRAGRFRRQTGQTDLVSRIGFLIRLSLIVFFPQTEMVFFENGELQLIPV